MSRDDHERDENLSPTAAFKEGFGLIRKGLGGMVGGMRREFKEGRLTENLREAGRELERAVRAAVDGVAQELPPNFIPGSSAGKRADPDATKAPAQSEPEAQASGKDEKSSDADEQQD